MKNPIIYIVINGELKMSPGKAAAQAVHASMMLGLNAREKFIEEHKRTVIVLEAKNSEQIKNLAIYLHEAGVENNYYIDEGVNEIDAYSVTALAAGPIASDDLATRSIFEAFELYGGHITVKRVDHFGFTESRVVIPNNIEIESKSAFKELKRSI